MAEPGKKVAEGLSVITYKNHEIAYALYDKEIGNNKQKTLALIDAVTDFYLKQPDQSVFGLSNIQNLHFDMDVLNYFKQSQTKISKKYKKLAVVGVSGLLKVGYNFVMGITGQTKVIKAFTSEEEGKEWLISG